MGKKAGIYQITIIGLMSAVICILGPLSIPIGVVPISFTNLAIYFAIYILGMKKAVISFLIYMLIGLVGVPVFSGFSGGISKLLGPTGGYIIGFFFMTLIAGIFIDKFYEKWYLSFVGMVLGAAVLYIFGTIWLANQTDMPLNIALAVGVHPFIPGDLAKIIIVAFIGPQIRKRLISANLIKA
ncbi:MAG: biotin transporter BioY [Acetivibrionales bacterium]|jgi:biotin transport system substrate-specific component